MRLLTNQYELKAAIVRSRAEVSNYNNYNNNNNNNSKATAAGLLSIYERRYKNRHDTTINLGSSSTRNHKNIDIGTSTDLDC